MIGRKIKLGFKEFGGVFTQGIQALVLVRLFDILKALARHWHASLGGKLLHAFDKREVVVTHDKAQHIAMGTTAKTVEKLLIVVHVKRR